jgi:hypothetical protein
VAGGRAVIGFLCHAAMFTAAGALASKSEDAQSVGLPLRIPLLVGYFVPFTRIGSGAANPLVTVLATVTSAGRSCAPGNGSGCAMPFGSGAGPVAAHS